MTVIIGIQNLIDSNKIKFYLKTTFIEPHSLNPARNFKKSPSSRFMINENVHCSSQMQDECWKSLLVSDSQIQYLSKSTEITSNTETAMLSNLYNTPYGKHGRYTQKTVICMQSRAMLVKTVLFTMDVLSIGVSLKTRLDLCDLLFLCFNQHLPLCLFQSLRVCTASCPKLSFRRKVNFFSSARLTFFRI